MRLGLRGQARTEQRWKRGGNGKQLHFNQCGVAAPLPRNPERCVTMTAPKITDFDDYAGGNAASYTYSVNAEPPAPNATPERGYEPRLPERQHLHRGGVLDQGLLSVRKFQPASTPSPADVAP